MLAWLDMQGGLSGLTQDMVAAALHQADPSAFPSPAQSHVAVDSLDAAQTSQLQQTQGMHSSPAAPEDLPATEGQAARLLANQVALSAIADWGHEPNPSKQFAALQHNVDRLQQQAGFADLFRPQGDAVGQERSSAFQHASAAPSQTSVAAQSLPQPATAGLLSPSPSTVAVQSLPQPATARMHQLPSYPLLPSASPSSIYPQPRLARPGNHQLLAADHYFPQGVVPQPSLGPLSPAPQLETESAAVTRPLLQPAMSQAAVRAVSAMQQLSMLPQTAGVLLKHQAWLQAHPAAVTRLLMEPATAVGAVPKAYHSPQHATAVGAVPKAYHSPQPATAVGAVYKSPQPATAVGAVHKAHHSPQPAVRTRSPGKQQRYNMLRTAKDPVKACMATLGAAVKEAVTALTNKAQVTAHVCRTVSSTSQTQL